LIGHGHAGTLDHLGGLAPTSGLREDRQIKTVTYREAEAALVSSTAMIKEL
jgi:hypothetical protein